MGGSPSWAVANSNSTHLDDNHPLKTSDEAYDTFNDVDCQSSQHELPGLHFYFIYRS